MSDDDLMTVRQAQQKLSCSRTKIYSLAAEGRLELVKFDKRTRVTGRSVRKLVRDLIQNTQKQAS